MWFRSFLIFEVELTYVDYPTSALTTAVSAQRCDVRHVC